jgi:N-methylhydantoinase A/oxoprolinase/acetone carboxylase beta subunit
VNRDSSKVLKLVESRIKDMGLAAKLRTCSSALGGVKRMAKARAIDTFQGSEVADINGAMFMMDKVGNENVIILDIGGAATSVGIIKGGVCEIEVKPLTSGLTIDLPRPAVKILNIGGDSVVSVDGKGMLAIGPASVSPDGTEPTVTDAKIVLGYDCALENYNKTEDQARKAVEEKIAKKLNISKEEASFKIIETVEAQIGDGIKDVLSAKGYDAKEFDIYVVGGASASHCCGLAKRVGAKRAVIFPFGSAFSAFGVTTMDIVYGYTAPAAKKDDLNNIIESLRAAGANDLRYEGFAEKSLEYAPAFIVKDENGSERIVQVESPNLQKEAENIASAKQEITAVLLKVSASPGKIVLEKHKEKKASKSAKTGNRDVYFNGESQQAELYSYGKIAVGSKVTGPAVIDLAGSSLILPKGCELSVDAYRNGIIHQKA